MSERPELHVECSKNPNEAPYTIRLADGRSFALADDDEALKLWRFVGMAMIVRMGRAAPGSVVASVVPMMMDVLMPSVDAIASKLRKKPAKKVSEMTDEELDEAIGVQAASLVRLTRKEGE